MKKQSIDCKMDCFSFRECSFHNQRIFNSCAFMTASTLESASNFVKILEIYFSMVLWVTSSSQAMALFVYPCDMYLII
mgnify:CR=1 FL=1